MFITGFNFRQTTFVKKIWSAFTELIKKDTRLGWKQPYINYLSRCRRMDCGLQKTR